MQRVVDAHPDVVAEIRAGKDRKFQFLVGQVMKETKGKGDPKIVTDLMRAAIGSCHVDPSGGPLSRRRAGL